MRIIVSGISPTVREWLVQAMVIPETTTKSETNTNHIQHKAARHKATNKRASTGLDFVSWSLGAFVVSDSSVSQRLPSLQHASSYAY